MKTLDWKNFRGFNFRQKNLNNKNLQKVQAGLKTHWKFLLGSFGITTAFTLNVMPFISGGFLGFVVYGCSKNDYVLCFIELSIYAATLVLLIIRGYETVSIYLVFWMLFFCTILSISIPYEIGIEKTFASFLLSLSIILAWLGSAITAIAITLTSLCCGIIGEFMALLGAGVTLIILPSVLKILIKELEYKEILVTSIATTAVILTGVLIARQAVRGSPKFAWIREKAVFWAATGGTSFYGVDLTDACFDGADLPHTDFRKAILTRASFTGATGLELARLQGTILEQPKVRKLLVKKEGIDEDYTGANFNGACLRGANLTGAILAEVQALDADFTGATLTDACIQGWNINTNTRFKDVKCKRIYLKSSRDGNKIKYWEPKPDSGEFKPGEFEKWIGEIQNTVDLIFREGLNWRAFIFSLAQTAIEHEELDLSRYSITRKDENTVFAKIGVLPNADNAAIHQAFQSNYEYAEKAIEEKYQLVLQAKDSEIERLKPFAESNQQILRELMSIAAGTGRQILIQGEAHRIYLLNQAEGAVEIMDSKKENTFVNGDMVNGNKTTSGDVNIGDVNLSDVNLNNSSMALVNLNSQVTNTIQQLKDISTDSSDKLAEILTLLQKSITDDAALSESQKKEALEAVETITEEAKKPPEERALKYCSMAMNALKGITGAVTDASKLAEVFKTYLPTLTGLLGI